MKKLYFALLLSLITTGAQAAESENSKLSNYINAIVAIPGNGMVDLTASLLDSVNSIISSFGKPFSDASKKIQENGNVSSK